MTEKSGRILRMLVPCCVVGALLAWGLALASACREALGERKPETLQVFVGTVRKTCQTRFPLRTAFVDLNGLWARMTGRRLCNNVFRRPDGLLVRAKVGEPLDPVRCADGILALANDVQASGAAFTFVQLPGKPDRGGGHLTAVVDRLQRELATRGIATLDLRDRYAGTDERLGRYFFRTDHHWNMAAVLDAAGILADRMQTDGARFFAIEKWERRELKDWFLGSQGKRTGVFFGGLDDLVYYLPRGQGSYLLQFTSPDGTVRTAEGGFDVNIDALVETNCGDVHQENAYKIYRGIGGVWPCVRHRHADAPIRKRVALIGDSFVRPLEACLSAALSDLLVIDPRYPCGGTSVREKLGRFNPDEVFVCINPFALIKNKGLYPQYAFCEFP